jgi:hypothetical protein
MAKETKDRAEKRNYYAKETLKDAEKGTDTWGNKVGPERALKDVQGRAIAQYDAEHPPVTRVPPGKQGMNFPKRKKKGKGTGRKGGGGW